MAHSKDTWATAKTLFEMGRSLAEIELDTGISKSQVSRKATAQGWKKGETQQLKADIVGFEEENAKLNAKKATLSEQLSLLSEAEVEVFAGVVEDELRLKSILFNTTVLNVLRVNKYLQENVKLEKLGMGKGFQGMQEVALGAGDFKECQDTIDKASLTLGINKRHAATTVAVQSNTHIGDVEIEGYEVTEL